MNNARYHTRKLELRPRMTPAHPLLFAPQVINNPEHAFVADWSGLKLRGQVVRPEVTAENLMYRIEKVRNLFFPRANQILKKTMNGEWTPERNNLLLVFFETIVSHVTRALHRSITNGANSLLSSSSSPLAKSQMSKASAIN